MNAFPEIIEDQLELLGMQTGTTVQFNSRGTLMAVGCWDGRIVIYDFETRSFCRELKGKHHLEKRKNKGYYFDNNI
jgi:COMPASS component SWD1